MNSTSPCCDAILYPFISGGGGEVRGAYKMCVECKKHYEWNLNPGQKPLFKRDKD